MASKASNHELSQALVASVRYGSYPESEEVISSDLPSEALPIVLGALESARQELYNEVGVSGQNSARDVDGWILQAKLVQAKIERSKAIAKEIVNQAQQESHVHERYEDSSRKAALLSNEVEFSQGLISTLEQIQSHQKTLDQVEIAPLEEMSQTVLLLDSLDNDLRASDSFTRTSPFDLLRVRTEEQRKRLEEQVEGYWSKELVKVDKEKAITFVPNSARPDFETVVDTLRSLHLFDGAMEKLYSDIDATLLQKRLDIGNESSPVGFRVNHQTIGVSRQDVRRGVKGLFEDLEVFIRFIHQNLPPSVAIPLSDRFMPRLITSLTTTWLPTTVPFGLTGMKEFRQVLDTVRKFGAEIDSMGWDGREDLDEWVDLAPRAWLTKQRERALENTRTCFFRDINTKTVERVETRKISRQTAEDDWDAGWSTSADDDGAAWGSDEDDGDEKDGAEWGWGDEDQEESLDTRKKTPKPSQDEEKEITLRETFSITELPEAILAIITGILSDGESLSLPKSRQSPVLPALPGLLVVPTLVLAMYRAAAPLHYSKSVGGMYMYNDSLWLAEELRSVASKSAAAAAAAASSTTTTATATATAAKKATATASGASTPKLKLDNDVKALEVFGKRAYSREMETQRTILGDLLDGAQGFANCTTSPYAAECEIAVQSTVDRIKDVALQWKPVLSRSAHLQSLGSLLTTVTNKFIVDVEDMTDISEAESQRLATFCSRISALEELFLPEQDSVEDVLPLTAVYCSSWLKFQYLANILESSLVDIKYLWTEGELKLEYSAGEVVDLIEALFADSDHRKRAIMEIRRS